MPKQYTLIMIIEPPHYTRFHYNEAVLLGHIFGMNTTTNNSYAVSLTPIMEQLTPLLQSKG